ncbi:hypothetical protein TRFO_06644 [Tritrichomonas foetus]|uniref:Uncharacterized protein n=1 Tax=Tritrichomonas foetus TaxID=1144522 RepID=A0A1J4JWN4_9EUKA|nr:hypothetical protein TRFO_06644 [Tritrichomonas foetus]|eukprot:OHT03419.1 hypothetical protein TRFO_06644 [Tritrichomonas foetus]
MTAPEFPTFLSQVFDVTQSDSIIGFQVTWNKKINENLNILQALSIQPRVYPVELIDHSGEMKQPGNYQLNINGKFGGFPFVLGYSRNSKPTASMNIPINENASINVASTISTYPDIGSSFTYLSNIFTSRIDIDINNYFKDGNMTLFSTYIPSPKYGFGGSLTLPLSQSSPPMLTLASQFSKGPRRSCLMIHHIGLGEIFENNSFAIGTTYTIEPKTIAGVTLKVDQNPLNSELRLGIQRNFVMSRISAVVSSSGIVQSFFQRNVRQGILLSTSACADNAHKIYTFGLGLVLES